jgi:plastocyanin
MFLKLFLFIAGCSLCFAPNAIGAAHPTTAPANTATFSLHGKVSAGGGLDLHQIDLTRVVIYLESDPVLDAVPLPAEHPSVAQKNKEFIPKFIVVPIGSVVEFPNWDHIAHNVFSRSAAAPAFDLDRYPYGQSKSRQFEKVGIVQIFCNIHPYMRAIVFVTPNVFNTRADKDGNFEIKNLPAGHYQLTAWQERCKPVHQLVTVGSAGTEITFHLEEDHNSIVSNDPPKRAGYGIERGLGVKQERLNLPVVGGAHPTPTTQP